MIVAADVEEFKIESVSDFIKSINDEMCNRKTSALFGVGLKNYLLYLLSAGVDGKLIIDYCRMIGEKFISFADQRSMKDYDLELARKKLNSALTNGIDESCIDEICKILSRFVSFDSSVSFRGHADYTWHAQPSIFRGRFYEYEREMYYEMIEREPGVFDEKEVYKNLALMQHYSCPTRLLDVTFNPLVALYFACQPTKKDPEVDGRVLVFVSPRCEFWDDLPVQAQSKVALLNYGRKKQFWKALLSGAPLESYKKDFTEAELKPVNFLFPVWVRTKKYAPRIERQSGAFVVVPEIECQQGNPTGQEQREYPLDHWCCKSYKIPGGIKDLILRELNALNINESSLFDGLDHVGLHVKTMYE